MQEATTNITETKERQNEHGLFRTSEKDNFTLKSIDRKNPRAFFYIGYII